MSSGNMRHKAVEEMGRNPDGTYHLGRALAPITGLSSEEIMWMAARMQELLKGGASREEAKAIVHEEGKARPWESVA